MTEAWGPPIHAVGRALGCGQQGRYRAVGEEEGGEILMGARAATATAQRGVGDFYVNLLMQEWGK